MTTDLTADQALRLAQWLSPAFPVGAFSYSHGLEWAVAQGDVATADGFRDWLTDILRHGAGRTDAILAAQTALAPDQADQLDALSRALAPSADRLTETVDQGSAFSRTTDALDSVVTPACSYPVAFGLVVARHAMPLAPALAMYLHAFAANLTGAAQRLVPIGQTDAQLILTGLAPLCHQIAADAVESPLEALGSSCFAADIASMRHETQQTRIFRS